MNRTIKFRGKRPINGEWIYGDLEYNVKADLARIHTYDKGGNYKRNYIVNSNTVGQFTGLHDCNGMEIYEGDILRFSPSAKGIGYVCWDNELAQFVVILIADRNQWYCIYRDSEIVGNIHDNPDLLKEE